MLKKCIICELIKLKRNPIWIAFLILPLLSAGFGTFNFIFNQGILSLTWDSLWTQHTLFLCFFFFPALIGTFCACLWRPEYLHNNLNLLMTSPAPRSIIYLSKLVISALVSILVMLWIVLLFFICGLLCKIPDAFPPVFLLWSFYGFLGTLGVSSLQLLFSLLIRKFAVPISISGIGAVLGLLFYAKGYELVFPYSLIAYGMHANNTKMMISVPWFLVSSLGFTTLFILIALFLLNKRDIKNA